MCAHQLICTSYCISWLVLREQIYLYELQKNKIRLDLEGVQKYRFLMRTFVRVQLLKVVSFGETNTARLLIWLRKWHIFNACFRSPRSTGHVRVNKFATRRSDLFYCLTFSLANFKISLTSDFRFWKVLSFCETLVLFQITLPRFERDIGFFL